MEEPLVTVIMPAYNAAQFIGQAIESVLGQTYRTLELIVVDDGSTDDTASVVRSYGDRVRYVHQPNARQAAARNTGLRHARGELIAFLDADDLWLPEKLTRQVALLSRNSCLGMVYCSLRLIDAKGAPIRDCLADLRGEGALDRVLLGQYTTVGAGSTALVPRAVLDVVEGFDVDLAPCEDTDLLWRIASRYPIDFIEGVHVLYRIHGGNSHRNIAATTLAWKGLYRKALKDPEVRALGWQFRLKCKGRLYYMLAGDHAQAGNWGSACGYALRGALAWPPNLIRTARKCWPRTISGQDNG